MGCKHSIALLCYLEANFQCLVFTGALLLNLTLEVQVLIEMVGIGAVVHSVFVNARLVKWVRHQRFMALGLINLYYPHSSRMAPHEARYSSGP